MFFEICNRINYQPQLVIPGKFQRLKFCHPQRIVFLCHHFSFFSLGCMILEIQIASSQCPEVKLPLGSLVHITWINEKYMGRLGYIKDFTTQFFNGDWKNTFINLYQPEQCYFFLVCSSSEVHMFFSVSVSSRLVEHVPVKTLLYDWIGWALEIPGSKSDKRQVLLKSESDKIFAVTWKSESLSGWSFSIRLAEIHQVFPGFFCHDVMAGAGQC